MKKPLSTLTAALLGATALGALTPAASAATAAATATATTITTGAADTTPILLRRYIMVVDRIKAIDTTDDESGADEIYVAAQVTMDDIATSHTAKMSMTNGKTFEVPQGQRVIFNKVPTTNNGNQGLLIASEEGDVWYAAGGKTLQDYGHIAANVKLWESDGGSPTSTGIRFQAGPLHSKDDAVGAIYRSFTKEQLATDIPDKDGSRDYTYRLSGSGGTYDVTLRVLRTF